MPSATVVTDQPSYYPGQTAYITGSGYAPNETVNLNIVLATGSQVANWSVTDDANGNFSTSVGIPSDGSWSDPSVNPLTLTGTGQTSGLSAQTTFTDPSNASLNQWQNGTASNPGGSWVNGDLNPQKSTLFEGDSVAYQDLFNGLNTAAGNTYVFQIQWETTKGGTHAQDYLTTDSFTWTQGSNSGASVLGHELDGANTSTWTTAQKTTPSTFAIPLDPNLNNNGASGTNPLYPTTNTMILGHTQVGGQVFKLFGGTISSIGGYTQYALTGDTFQVLNITFTASVPNPVLLWGGHIASRLDWGPGNSASFINGSPYHMFQNNLKLNGSAVSGVGQQDRSIKVGVIVFPTIIVVNKVATPNAAPNTNFSFTNTSNVFFVPQQPTNFVNSFTLTGSNQFVVPPYALPPSTATNATILETSTFNNTTLTRITENVPSGWTLSSITFFSQFSNPGNSSSGSTAILNCNGDDTLWVTFTDQVSATSLVTTANPNGTLTLGTGTQTLNDSAVLSGGSNPQGTITFKLYAPSNTLLYTDVVSANGDGTYNTNNLGTPAGGNTLATTGTVTGTYHWTAAYTPTAGDPNLPSSDPGTSAAEQLTVKPANPTLVTTASGAVTLGTTAPTLSDSAVVAGGYYETGSLVFTLTGPGGFSYTQSDTLSGNGTYTASTTLPTTGMVAGTYTWHVTYAGDANNNSAVDQGGAAEQTVVSKASPSIVTTASGAVTLGTTAPTLSDSAVLSGGYYETGSLVFTLTGPGGFSYTQSDTITGNGTYTASTTLPTAGMVAGTYTWSVTYAGDANNNSAVDQGGTAEQTVVSKASPSIVTTASGAVTLGTTAPTLSDSAVVAGGYYETGSLVFTLTGPGGFSYTQSDTITGNGTYTASTTLPTTGMVAGTYTWHVTYAGDANNNSAVDQGGSAEQTVVSKASPSIVTTAGGTVTVGDGNKLTDQADLEGGYYPTGSITFTLYNSANQVVDVETVTGINGDGKYNAPGYTPPLTGAGTYHWSATYNGDSNNQTATDPGGVQEQETVLAPNLTITKTGNGTVNSTDAVMFTITVSNTGNGTAFNVNLSDPLPDSAHLIWTTDAGTITSGTLSDAIGSLAAGASVTIHVSAVTPAGYSATLNNTATASSSNNVPGSVSASATDIVLAPNLTITKTGNGTVNSTDTVMFTIVVSNTGAGTAYNVNVSDPLPDSAHLTWTSDAGTITSGTLTDAIGSLASGASVTIHVSAATGAGYSATLNNTATASSSNNNPGSVSASATDVVLAPNLTITKTGNGTVNSTDTVRFTIVVSNTGAGTAYNVNVSDPLPDSAHLTWTSDAGTITSGTLSDAIGNLASGASVTIHVSATTAPGYSATLNNTATASSSNNSPGSVSASATDTVLAPNLMITKTGNGTVNSTDTVMFTIVVSNTGAGTAYNVNVSDPLPDSAHLTWTSDAGTITSGTLSDAIGSLASGASVTIHVSAATAPGYSATLNNTATASSSNNSPGSVSASATDTVLAPNLTITKTGNGTVNSTDTVRFTIVVSNTGAGTAYNVSVSDPLPDSAHLTWTTDAGTITSGTLSDAIGSLASGASVTIHVSATTAPGYSATLNNTATASSSNNNPGSVSASATDVVLAPNLTITKTGNGTVNSTDTVMFTIVVSNTGAGTAYNVNVSDPLPDSAHLTWISNAGTITSGTLSDAIGNLASGASVTIHVSATTAPGYSATLNNTATASSSNNSPGSVSASATDIVLAPHLTITKTADTATVPTGSPIGFTITVSNTGAGAAYNVNLNDPLPTPAGINWISATLVSGTAPAPTLSGNTLSDAIGTLASGGTVVFHVHGMAMPSYVGTLTNTATVTSTNNVPGSLQASASITVIPANIVTNTSFCQFTNNQFNLIYINNTPSTFQMNASNPGQFYDNIFYAGNPGDTVTLNIQVPFPFITQGANPIHVDSTYAIAGQPGSLCFTPGTDVTGGFNITTAGGNHSTSGAPVILLGDYGSSSAPAPGVGTTTTTVTITGTIPASGLLYANIHLQVGLIPTVGWNEVPLPTTPITYNATNTTLYTSTLTVLQNQSYNFSDTATGSSTVGSLNGSNTPTSVNDFKKTPGAGGTITALSTTNPIPGVTVQLFDSSNNLLGTATTDSDGCYLLNYKNTGGRATFHVTATYGAWTNTVSFVLQSNGFSIQNMVDSMAQHLGGWSAPGNGITDLTEAELQPVVAAAYALWANDGLTAAQLKTLANADIQIADLQGDLLGQTYYGSNLIQIDRHAHGLAWYTNVNGRPTPGTVDLLTVVTHELGHLLGLEDQDNTNNVMEAYLGVGVRNVVLPLLQAQGSPATSSDVLGQALAATLNGSPHDSPMLAQATGTVVPLAITSDLVQDAQAGAPVQEAQIDTLFAEWSAPNAGDATIGDPVTLGLDPTRGVLDSRLS